MKKPLAHILTGISLLSLIVAVFLMVQVIQKSEQRQQLSHDLAELYNIKYGLLSADEWKVKASQLLKKKIETFVLDADTRELMKSAIEYALDKMVTELEGLLKADPKSDDWTDQLKHFLHDNALVPMNLRDKIDDIAESVLKELEKDEVQDALKKYLNEQVDQLMNEADKTVKTEAIDYIKDHYGYPTIESCAEGLMDRIIKTQETIWFYALLALLPALLGFRQDW